MSNVLTFTGTIGNDAEVRYLPSGTAVLSFNAANNIGYGDKQKTVWLRVVLWGKRAEGNLIDYLKKGQRVFVSGELSTNEYQAKDGTNKIVLEINAGIIELIGKRSSEDNQRPAKPVMQSPQYQQPYHNDDIPY